MSPRIRFPWRLTVYLDGGAEDIVHESDRFVAMAVDLVRDREFHAVSSAAGVRRDQHRHSLHGAKY